MGVIARQGLKYSIVSYISLILGTVNVLFLYTRFLTEEEIGIQRYIVDFALTVIPFASFGLEALVVRFFPKFKSSENNLHNGFLGFLCCIPIPFILLTTIVISLLPPAAVKEPVGVSIMIVLLIYTKVFTNFCINFNRIVVPNLINNLVVKILSPILAFVYYYHDFPFYVFVYGVVSIYSFTLALLIAYVIFLRQFNLRLRLSYLNKELLYNMFIFQLYGILGRIGTELVNRLDIIMLAILSGLKYTGIYTIALVIARAIDIPKQALNSISLGILNKAFNSKNLEEVKNVYYKSCLVQYIGALFLFTAIWLSIDSLFDFLPDGSQFKEGKYVVFYLGLAKIIDAITGTNNEVIGLSKYFRFNFYIILLLALINFVLNWILIPIYLLQGAAIASMLSVFFYNIGKSAYIYYRYKMNPLTGSYIGLGLYTLAVYMGISTLPSTTYPILDIFITSSLFSLLYAVYVYMSKISTDINELLNKLFALAFNKR